MMPAMPTPRLCATCLVARVQWEHANRPALEKAMAELRAAVEAGEQPTDMGAYLPDEVKASMPQVNPSVTSINGTECCAGHLPGMPGGRQPLLIAHSALTPGLMGQMANGTPAGR